MRIGVILTTAAILFGSLLFGAVRTGYGDEYKDEIGWTRLGRLLGPENVPDGTGVAVTHVEAAQPEDSLSFLPVVSNFLDKQFSYGTLGGSPSSEGHATIVGRRFYGEEMSIAGGISRVETYLAISENGADPDGWIIDILQLGSNGRPPRLSPHGSRIANHSYLIDFESDADNIELLERIDWLAATDDYIQVVGSNNKPVSKAGFSSAYNVISVGVLSGEHSVGSVELGERLYTAGRSRPDLVDDDTATSFATARISAAAAVLVEMGRSYEDLSSGKVVHRNLNTVRHAETLEVVRAALMAGASRQAVTDFDNGAVYTVNTDNGLDGRFGAGRLNIFDSYNIVAAGEQGPGLVDITGFDYEPSFTNGQAVNYRFDLDSERRFSASLVWNIDVDLFGLSHVRQAANRRDEEPLVASFEEVARLYDLNLNLYRQSGDEEALIISSASSLDNTENLFSNSLPAGSYRIEVSSTDDEPFRWDYGLAWTAGPRRLGGAGRSYFENFDSQNTDLGRNLPDSWRGVFDGRSDRIIDSLGLETNSAKVASGIVNVGANGSRFRDDGNVAATWRDDLNQDGQLNEADLLADAAGDRALGIAKSTADQQGRLALELEIADDPLRALVVDWDVELWGGNSDPALRGSDGGGFRMDLLVGDTLYYSQTTRLGGTLEFDTDTDNANGGSRLIDGNIHAVRGNTSGILEIASADGTPGNLIELLFDADLGDSDFGWLPAIDNVRIRSLVAGDTDGDGGVGTDDLLNILAADKFGQGPTEAKWSEGDFDQNDEVDVFDLLAMQGALQGIFPRDFEANESNDSSETLRVLIDPNSGNVTIDYGDEQVSTVILQSLSGVFSGPNSPDWDGQGLFTANSENQMSDSTFGTLFTGVDDLGDGIVVPGQLSFADLADDISVSFLSPESPTLLRGQVVVVPEPSTLLLFLTGLIAIGVLRRRAV